MSTPTPSLVSSTCTNSCACAEAGYNSYASDGLTPPGPKTTTGFDLAACNTVCNNDLTATKNGLLQNKCDMSYDLSGASSTCLQLCAGNTCAEGVCLAQCANFNLCQPIAINSGGNQDYDQYGNGLDAWPSQ